MIVQQQTLIKWLLFFKGRLDIVKYLIEHYGDVNLANAYNNTCITIAACEGHETG